jgi:hypothetical protein
MYIKMYREYYKRLATGQWFSLSTPVSFINKTDHHDILWQNIVQSGVKDHNPTINIKRLSELNCNYF